jgi:tRNA-dihydrouridine synthase B
MNKYNLKRPFYALAPMANITTYPFASQAIEYGADLVWTPMVHTDTIINNWAEAEKALNFKEIKNYLVQIVGSEPEKFAESVRIIEANLSPLGIDLNFACPDKNIVKSGCGGALMQDNDKMVAIVKAVKVETDLPISVKTRAGWDNPEDIFKLAPKLWESGISLLTVHPRTVKSGFVGSADWSILKRLHDLKTERVDSSDILLVGSGDIKTWQEAMMMRKKSRVDGLMIGRGALGRPWIFEEVKAQRDHPFDLDECKGRTLALAAMAFEINGEKGIIESRTHFANYFKGFPEAKGYRARLMTATTLADVQKIIG